MAEDRARFRRGFDPENRTIKLNPRTMQSMRNEKARNFPEVGRGGGNPQTTTRVNIPFIGLRQDDGTYEQAGFDVSSTFTSQFDPSRAGRTPSGAAVQGFNPGTSDVSGLARAQPAAPVAPAPAQVNYENFAAQAGGRVPEALGGGFATEGARITNTGGKTVLTNVAGIPDIDSPSSFDADAYTAQMNQRPQRGGNPEPAVDRYAFDTRLTPDANPDNGQYSGRFAEQNRQIRRQRTYESLVAQGVPPATAREQVLVEESKPPSFASALRSQLVERLASRAGADVNRARAESLRTETGFLPEVTESEIGYRQALSRQADATAATQNASAVAALMPEPAEPAEPITAPMQVGTDTTGVPIYEDRAFLQTDRGFQPFEDVIAQPQPGTVEGFRSWARRQLANPENAGATQTELLEIYRERFPEFSLDGS